MVAPNTLVGKIDVWLQVTGQGMWPRQLPLVKQTKCVGWLLFSAPKYNWNELRKQLYQATGVSVALQFRSIQNSLPDRAITIAPGIKATHLEIDQYKPRDRWQHLFQIFLLKSQMFLLGIKMRLVAETRSLSTSKAQLKVETFHICQARFLNNSTICTLRAQPHSGYDKWQTQATLKKFLLTNPQQTKPAYHLFYAVSPLTKTEGFSIRFLPQHKGKTQQILAQLTSLLPGIMADSSLQPKQATNTHIDQQCKPTTGENKPTPTRVPKDQTRHS